jgi:UDP-N-acetylglucosamine--N-acetylmuramyl-(pentapeptide) pyrophosphoryl-undecaprenol N-acetylglucosamine transferase
MAESHLVVGRSGASTVSELGVIGRPAILVPLPGALDQDQAANAHILAEAGAAVVIPQTAFTPVSLADLLQRLVEDPERLQRMAMAARSTGVSDASARLATEVLSIAAKG